MVIRFRPRPPSKRSFDCFRAGNGSPGFSRFPSWAELPIESTDGLPETVTDSAAGIIARFASTMRRDAPRCASCTAKFVAVEFNPLQTSGAPTDVGVQDAPRRVPTRGDREIRRIGVQPPSNLGCSDGCRGTGRAAGASLRGVTEKFVALEFNPRETSGAPTVLGVQDAQRRVPTRGDCENCAGFHQMFSREVFCPATECSIVTRRGWTLESAPGATQATSDSQDELNA